MNWFKRTYRSLQTVREYSASDPQNFEKIWSLRTSSIRLISLLLLVVALLICLGGVFVLKGPFARYFGSDSASRAEIERQYAEMNELKDHIDAQEEYIASIQSIFSGQDPERGSDTLDIDNTNGIQLDSLSSDITEEEAKLSQLIKDDMRTSKVKNAQLAIFDTPVYGEVSQRFEENHLGIDVVAKEGTTVQSCFSGVVIFKGYTQKDGYVIIVQHPNDFLSIYKHNRTILRKVGDVVKIGDPIAMVGNTGSSSDGPHLHFELWYHQEPVDPERYITFKK